MKTYHLANPLMHGEDLKPLQQALKAAKLYDGPIDGIFGNACAHACQHAKYRLGYPTSEVKLTGGTMLLDFLKGTKPLPPAYKQRRQQRGIGISQTEVQRKAVVGHALWGEQNKAQIHYAQVRPMDHLHQVRKLPWMTDCSEFVTTIYCWAGAPDPNGRNFNGEGYTGTMLDNGRQVQLFQAKPGDAVIWGVFPGHHTAVIVDVTNHVDPVIVSHGQENGPLKIPLSAENGAQGGRPYQIRRYLRD